MGGCYHRTLQRPTTLPLSALVSDNVRPSSTIHDHQSFFELELRAWLLSQNNILVVYVLDFVLYHITGTQLWFFYHLSFFQSFRCWRTSWFKSVSCFPWQYTCNPPLSFWLINQTLHVCLSIKLLLKKRGRPRTTCVQLCSLLNKDLKCSQFSDKSLLMEVGLEKPGKCALWVQKK